MKRDWTVPASLIALFLSLLMMDPAKYSSQHSSLRGANLTLQDLVLGLVLFLSVVRAIVLWHQTLIHGIHHAKEENRVAVVIAHVYLSALMSYAYYFMITPAVMAESQRLAEKEGPAEDAVP